MKFNKTEITAVYDTTATLTLALASVLLLGGHLILTKLAQHPDANDELW